MRKWWQPSSGFFQRVPKSVAIAAMRETDARPEVISGVEKDSKADAVATALDHLAETGWLPAPLRSVETPAHVVASDEPETEEDCEALPEAAE